MWVPFESAQRVVVVDPVAHERGGVFIRADAADHLTDARVDDQPPAHGAGRGVGVVFAGLGVAAHMQ